MASGRRWNRLLRRAARISAWDLARMFRATAGDRDRGEGGTIFPRWLSMCERHAGARNAGSGRPRASPRSRADKQPDEAGARGERRGVLRPEIDDVAALARGIKARRARLIDPDGTRAQSANGVAPLDSPRGIGSSHASGRGGPRRNRRTLAEAAAASCASWCRRWSTTASVPARRTRVRTRPACGSSIPSVRAPTRIEPVGATNDYAPACRIKHTMAKSPP